MQPETVSAPSTLTIDASLLKPGLRLAVGVSGGADSVALLRALAERSREFGLVLHVAHLHHGLRGAEADGDMEFVRALAAELGLRFHCDQVDVAAAAKANPGSQKPAESIEEAARRLRYSWFRQLLAMDEVDAIATAHTRDDQAETVLAKFLRGAWTEGLSGIHPVVTFPEGRVIRPLLGASRAEVESFLTSRNHVWREDSSNTDTVYTRNRVRRELLPLLESWNPQIREHLTQMADLAREEEAWWDAQLRWLGPQVVLPGTPVRGGGRTAAEPGLAVEATRLAAQPVAMQRRLLRHAAAQLGVSLGFAATESLRALALSGRAGEKRELAQGLRGERTHREVQLTLAPGSLAGDADETIFEYQVTIPGEIEAEAFGLRVRVDVEQTGNPGEPALPRVGWLRSWRAGDRVRLRHSGGSHKVKEVLDRMRVSGSSRTLWPVLEVEGHIVWMQGAILEPEAGITVIATELQTQ
jgi:tRNA(Ile)-lysidine synthase